MKSFNHMQSIGKCRHVINFHDGEKTHADGSPFYDARIFGNKRAAQQFMRSLLAAGYSEKTK